MKITILMPPALKGKAPERIFGCNYGLFYQPNIFILYSAAVLEKNNHKVKVLDCPVEKISWRKLENILKEDNSNLYVFYTVFLSEEIDKYAHKLIRKLRGNIPIVFIGPEPTSRPKDFLLDKNTFVIRGEADYALLELVNELEKNKNFKKIKGLSWKHDKKIIHNPQRPILTNKELDKLPFPARHLIKKELYYNPKLRGRPSTVMLTSRGCWGRCIYCIPCSYMFAREIENKRFSGLKPKVGLRSPENIIKEFKLLKRQGYKAVAIIDDNFINGEERTIKICKGIKNLGIEWGCLARPDTLQNEDMIKAMAEAGCVYIDIGAESFDQKVLDFVHKDLKVGDIFNAIFLLKKHGIEPKVNILFGTSPYETEESIKWTVKMLKELDIEWVSFDVTIPHPNTEFYKFVKRKKWFGTKSGDYEPVDPLRSATVNFPNLSHKKLEELVKWAYREYYLRPKYVWKRLLKIKNVQELKELIRTAWRLFF